LRRNLKEKGRVTRPKVAAHFIRTMKLLSQPADTRNKILYATSPLKGKRNRRTDSELDTLLAECKSVIASYDEKITIRHLFYRLESRGFIEKSERGYSSLCQHLSKWRKQREIPFDAFIDGTRWHYGATVFDDADDAMRDSVQSYRKNLWVTQPYHVEIWAEKDAIASIVRPVSESWGLQTFICRGFASISSLYNAASTFECHRNRGKAPRILYMGDHDPSGLAIDAAISKAWRDFGTMPPGFKRIAILPKHIEQFQLPTRPMKNGDMRGKNWIGGCVEVDTLTPAQIRELLEREIIGLVDPEAWERTKLIEKAEADTLAHIFHMNRDRLQEASK